MRKSKRLKTAVVIIISVLVLIVILQNTQSVETKLLFATITMPRALLLLLTFLFGFIAGAISTIRFSRDKAKDN